jgi:hypothetical protein
VNKPWFKPFVYFGGLFGGVIILIIIIAISVLLTVRHYQSKLDAQTRQHEQELLGIQLDFDKQRNEWLETCIDKQVEKYGQAVYDVCYLSRMKFEPGAKDIVDKCHKWSGYIVGKGGVWNAQHGWDVERMRMESSEYR